MSSFINSNLDLVFCMDCTGSMGPYIQEAKDTIKNIIKKINEKSECKELRFGLVSYRDHPPQEKTYVTKKYDFTDQIDIIQNNLNELTANGGGDGPEAVTSALYEINNLDWKSESTKIVILISDAPPHGLGEVSDGFPNGDPDGHDPIIIAKELASKGIVVYTVGCEPEINNYEFARAFLISIANLTGGQPISLSDAKLLADVILGSTIEELGINKLLKDVDKETQKVRNEFTLSGRHFTDDMVLDQVYTNLSSTGVTTPQVKGCELLRDISEGIIENSTNLKSASENLKSKRSLSTSLPPLRKHPKIDFHSPLFTDKIEVVDDLISKDQVKRLITRATSSGKN